MKIILGGILFSFLLIGCKTPKGTNDPKNFKLQNSLDGNWYKGYSKLLLTGYQGWFAAEGDISQRGWYHYENKRCAGFYPGCAAIDFWPDVQEYQKTYPSPFLFPDGATARLFSSVDNSTTDLHFKWMKDYGIDGVFMQRFVVEIKNPKGKLHFNKVLRNALEASKKHKRAICVMYDLSGCTEEDIDIIAHDWQELENEFALRNSIQNPGYLWQNKKPLLAIWGVGFNDGRKYTINKVDQLVTKLKSGRNPVSIMLGVPYYWREGTRDALDASETHRLFAKADIIMPWAVGRYNNDNYESISSEVIKEDMKWCSEKKITYIPLAFPGFSWGNLKRDTSLYNSIPRLNGSFIWKQFAGAKEAGADAVYVAMFDEIDEGTAIFKCLPQDKVPFNPPGRFSGIEENLPSDHYLWLTGQAAKWFRNEKEFDFEAPVRY